ncbi:MAG: hypothetical protein LQ341_006827 [Variospora aurantia]|nr:MAG: hypothetical protein LQ341_006827 [Variospora aurantia]
MHLAVSFTTLLASVTLLSTVASTPINSKLGRRAPFDNDDEEIDDDDDLEELEVDGDDEIESLSDLCTQSSDKLKRHLVARATLPALHTEVKPGKSDYQDLAPLGLWTDFLVSCTGVVVIGTKSEGDGGGGSGRALAHIMGTKDNLSGEWADFKGKVEKMKLSNKKGFMSSPLLDDNLPKGWKDELSKVSKDTEAAIKEKLAELVDNPTIVQRFHRMKEASERKGANGFMSVNGQDVVYIDGEQVS